MSVSMLLNAALTVDEASGSRPSPSPAVAAAAAAAAVVAPSADGARRIPITFLLASDSEPAAAEALTARGEHQEAMPCHSRGTSWGTVSRQSSQTEPSSAGWGWSDLTASGDSRSSMDGGSGGGPRCRASASSKDCAAAAGGRCTAAAASAPMELASPPPPLPAVPLMSIRGGRSGLLLAPFEFKGGAKRDWAGMHHSNHVHNNGDHHSSHTHRRDSQGDMRSPNRHYCCIGPAPSTSLTLLPMLHWKGDCADGVRKDGVSENCPDDDVDRPNKGNDDDDDDEGSGEYCDIDSHGPIERLSGNGIEETVPSHAGLFLGRKEDERAPRRRWKDWEDALLIQVVEREGPSRWNEIAKSFPGRNGRQVRLRWMNHLQPSLDKAPWRQEEDEMLLSAHAAHGNKWALIAAQLGSRTDNAVKNRFKSLQRRNYREQRASIRSGFRNGR
jgi:hypothetical protein